MDVRESVAGVEGRNWGGSSLSELERQVENLRKSLDVMAVVVQSLVKRVEALGDRK